MEYLLTAAQMKRCDQNTIERIGIPSLVLMERAALSVVEAMYQEKLDLSSVLVLCGSGNNGGDGFAVARMLGERNVRVWTAFVGSDASMTDETAKQRKMCENCGIKNVSNFKEHEYTTIVDAIFGIGLSREVQRTYADVINWVNAQKAKVAAVDIPSGICADTGKIMGTAIRADLTVTFAYKKPGMVFYPGTQYCGKLIRSDIGILAERFDDIIPEHFIYGREDIMRMPRRNPYSNKGTYGKVLLIAGSNGMSGAACLSALAAYRSGCGLVRVFTPECNRAVIQMYLPEAIVTCYEENGCWQEALCGALNWADVTAIGPGLGQSESSEAILKYVMQYCQKPLVIDADGLNLIARNRKLLKEHTGDVIVTPHVVEMMRLMDASKEEVLRDIVQSAKQFAKEYGLICVLKDARTVVSDGERVYINVSGNSGMAVGGSGDVLTGVIAGILVQQIRRTECRNGQTVGVWGELKAADRICEDKCADLLDTAALGVYLHGLAGDAAKEKMGEHGMLASDTANAVSEVLKSAER